MIIADEISYDGVVLEYSGPQSKGKLGHRDTHKENTNWTVKAEIGVMHLQGMECLRLPTNHQNLGEKRGVDSPSQPSREPSLLTPESWVPSIQNCETTHV